MNMQRNLAVNLLYRWTFCTSKIDKLRDAFPKKKHSFFWTLPKLPIPLASDLDNFSTLFCPESKNCQNEFGQGDLPPIEAMQKRKVFF